MKPGPELNALIAEQVMGLKDVGYYLLVPLFAADYKGEYKACEKGDVGPLGKATLRHYVEHVGFRYVRSYSTRISDAWRVVERLGLVYVEFGRFDTYVLCLIASAEFGSFSAEGETEAHAICLVALKAVEAR